MPFDPTDARAALAPTPTTTVPERFSGSEHVRFGDLPPVERTGEMATWYARGQNFVVAYSELTGSGHVGRTDDQEWVVLLPDAGVSATARAGDDEVPVSGPALVVMPPGATEVELTGAGRVLRLMRSTGAEAALAPNAASYDQPHENIPPFAAWPDPADGHRIRTYDLTVPPMRNPPFRLFRCSTFMVNFIDPIQGPRDPAKLSPHTHDDFEQCSIVLAGDYVHHIRWPWTTNKANWREDEHEFCTAPSVTVIPPPSLHTSEAVGTGTNHLIDVFSPPRFDFSEMPGWVLNADEYPAPAR